MGNLADILDFDPAEGPPSERMLQILTEACRLFATRGFDGVSVRDIAEECGISKATLYHYFPDKDAILRPLVLGITRSLHLHVAAALPRDAGPVERLRVFMTESVHFFEQHRWAYIVSSTVFWTDPKLRHRRERIEWRDRHEALLRGILADGVEAGVFRIADIGMAGRLIFGALNWMPKWFDPKGPLSGTEIAERFLAMLLDGLSPR